MLRLAAVLLALFPVPALAYYPCAGPGPGEVLIGVDNTNGYQQPLCEYVGEDGGGSGDPGGYWADSYGALAWGSDPSGYATYAYTYGASSQAEAEGGAVAECQASGFSDCRPATFVVNGSIVVVIDKAGTLDADWGATDGEAKRKAMRNCRQRGGKGCKVEGTISSPAFWVSY